MTALGPTLRRAAALALPRIPRAVRVLQRYAVVTRRSFVASVEREGADFVRGNHDNIAAVFPCLYNLEWG